MVMYKVAIKSSYEVHVLSEITMDVWTISGVADSSPDNGTFLCGGASITSHSMGRSTEVVYW